MAQYRDLNAPPRQTFADIVAEMRDQAKSSKTGSAGVKDLGEYGDVVWSRPDGAPVSVRDVDLDLADARERIEDAEQSLADSQVRLDEAEQQIQATQSGLDTLENETLPAAVEALEQADQAAQEQFDDLDIRLGDFATNEALAPIREALSDAQAAVEAAQGVAESANQAANAASQAALEAAGIAESKGRVIIQETEPTGEDRKASNIWIKPIPDNPDTEIEEKAITYVYLEASNEWVPTSSDELAQAAQNALDAREAAQQAQQRAETAVANAATAQGAAEAAQRTADQATLDAAGAHNEAVAASEAANAALDRATTPTANMINNGNGSRGMENFELRSPWIRYPEDAPTGAHASYAIEVPGAAFLDRSVAVDPSRQYVMKAAVRQANPDYEPLSDRFYMALQPLDGDGLSIATTMYARFADTLTTLAADLKPGDTTATLSSSEAWDGATTYKTLAIYDYTDASGKHWGTDYTRITARFVALSEGVVTLAAPWSGGTVGAGTPVAQALHGGAYLYPLVPSAIPHEWTGYTSQIVGGIHDPNGAVAVYRLPVPTASVRPGFLFNYTGQTESRHRVANIALFDVTEAVAAQAAADAAQKRADEAYTEAALKATPAEVEAAADAAEKSATEAAAADATAKAAQAKADALSEAAVTAQEKADAAKAQAVADAAADAKAKADQALQDALDALATARGEITAEIKASANGKNSITVSTEAPTSSTPGVVAGDTWWRVDSSSNIFGQWTWTGSTWSPRTIRSEVIANLDVHKLQVTGSAKIADAVIDKLFAETFVAHKITGSELSIASVKPDGSLADDSVSAVTIRDGAITTPKLTVTEDMSAKIVTAMSTVSKELIVTESAVLNHVTAIGQTVVDDINVQGKLIGTDGVFTGTVDFENVNVTGELLASKISGEYLYGTVIEGGEIRTSDELPGQVSLRDDGYVDGDGVPRPGIRINPTSTYNPSFPPAIGSNANGLIITGGTSAGGDRAFAAVQPDAVALTSRNTGMGRTSELYANTTEAVMYSRGASGARASLRAKSNFADVIVFDSAGKEVSSVHATPSRAGIAFGQGLARRVLDVDADGVWARADGAKVSLIPEVRPFQYSAQWNADQSPAPIMVQHLPGGKLCQAQIRIQNLTGSSLSLPNETWVTLNYNPIPSDLRGGFTDYIETTLPQASARGRIEMNYSTGSIRIRNISGANISWTNNNSIWFPMRWFSPN